MSTRVDVTIYRYIALRDVGGGMMKARERGAKGDKRQAGCDVQRGAGDHATWLSTGLQWDGGEAKCSAAALMGGGSEAGRREAGLGFRLKVSVACPQSIMTSTSRRGEAGVGRAVGWRSAASAFGFH
jgi:hypothetical protein